MSEAPITRDAYAGPSITAQQLSESLISEAVITGERLEEILGANRHQPSLNQLELALSKNNTLSEERLLSLKGMVSGLGTASSESTPIEMFPAQLAKACGAIALDGQRPAVAFIEDTSLNVERVRAELGHSDFEIVLMTTTQFTEWFRIAYSELDVKARPVLNSLMQIFDEAINREASDLHLTAGASPVFRIGGDLVEMPFQPLAEDFLQQEFRRLLGDESMNELAETNNRDAAYGYGDVRFRINLGHDIGGTTAALRRLPSDIPTFDQLNLPEPVRNLCDLERGLVLVTGPTGSGKSTTLASMLAHIGMNQSRHIVTLEDPIEFLIPSQRSVVHQRELGNSFTSFSNGLRQALRQDPDVILVGEARDRETIGAAVTAAETGALVFATLHTFDAVSTLARIVNTYPEGEQDQIRSQLAYVLRGVVSQTLLPSLQGGRVAGFEVLLSTTAVSNNLRKVDGLNQLRQVLQTSVKHGMQTMEYDLARLVRRGLISQSDAEYKARDVDELNMYLSGNNSADDDYM